MKERKVSQFNSKLVVLQVVLACNNAWFPARFEHVAMDANHSVPDPKAYGPSGVIVHIRVRDEASGRLLNLVSLYYSVPQYLGASPSFWCTINTL